MFNLRCVHLCKYENLSILHAYQHEIMAHCSWLDWYLSQNLCFLVILSPVLSIYLCVFVCQNLLQIRVRNLMETFLWADGVATVDMCSGYLCNLFNECLHNFSNSFLFTIIHLKKKNMGVSEQSRLINITIETNYSNFSYKQVIDFWFISNEISLVKESIENRDKNHIFIYIFCVCVYVFVYNWIWGGNFR